MPGPARNKTGFTRAGVRRPPSSSQDFDRATTGLPALGIELALDASGIPNCSQDISLPSSGLPSLGNESAAEASLEEAAPTPATGQEAQVITLDSSGSPSGRNKSAAESSLEEAATLLPWGRISKSSIWTAPRIHPLGTSLWTSPPWRRQCLLLPGGRRSRSPPPLTPPQVPLLPKGSR